jgi:hypothetical protein
MPRTDRPYFRYTTRELAAAAIVKYNDRDELALILAELRHRTILPAEILRSFVSLRVAELETLPPSSTPADEEPDTPSRHGTRVVTLVRAEEEIGETTRDNVQSTVVEVWGLDERGGYARRRRGFLLDERLLVTGSFADDATIAEIEILRRGDELVVDPLPLDVHQAVDLNLHAAVDRFEASSDWEMLMAEITPPNVGDTLAIATESDWVEFEFRTMREIPGWGAVLALPTLSLDTDGAPIVNEFGQLVGVTRVRWVDGEAVSFGLPLRWLFDLIRGTLASKLAYLRECENRMKHAEEWDEWKAKEWDPVLQMTNGEAKAFNTIRELMVENLSLKGQLEAESSETKDSVPPLSEKGWPWLRRLFGSIWR